LEKKKKEKSNYNFSSGSLKDPVYSHVRDVQEPCDLSDAELFFNKEI